jgi:hypothetical protein
MKTSCSVTSTASPMAWKLTPLGSVVLPDVYRRKAVSSLLLEADHSVNAALSSSAQAIICCKEGI